MGSWTMISVKVKVLKLYKFIWSMSNTMVIRVGLIIQSSLLKNSCLYQSNSNFQELYSEVMWTSFSSLKPQFVCNTPPPFFYYPKPGKHHPTLYRTMYTDFHNTVSLCISVSWLSLYPPPPLMIIIGIFFFFFFNFTMTVVNVRLLLPMYFI